MNAKLLLLPGDGIGPEVVEVAARALRALAGRFGHRLVLRRELIGGAALDAGLDPLPAATRAALGEADAVLLGAVGGPRWNGRAPERRPERGLLDLRRELGVFANLRPVRRWPGSARVSPLRSEVADGTDVLFVRELTGGLYFGEPRLRHEDEHGRHAVDTLRYSEEEIRRVVRRAFELARGRRGQLCSVDKANVLESSRLWREVAEEVATEFPEVRLEHRLVDSFAYELLRAPRDFDVVVTENLFGDILSDEAAALSGSLGVLASASLGHEGPGLFEPVHGSAPDLAGRGLANPVGALASAALLLRHGLGLEKEARTLERATEAALADGCRTPDLGGSATTVELSEAVVQRIEAGSRRLRHAQ